ncbi:unnamed protein product [Medioppia subpectinata]|uniref:Alpha-latrotoxin n=1 Tax=Medioppia subpectinata TaxID=1979941 RepID=A0A7R9KQN9_9ACAR|nr:unnamed protein product [Medioppia subpectinata]CAG2106641.1 unnamed protein product [Medioppia subpectinata]
MVIHSHKNVRTMLWEYNDRLNDCSDALSDAIKNVRYRQFELLVGNGTNANACDSCMRTPLIMISIYLTGFDNWYNRERFAKLLLDNNANPNLCDIYGLTPLIHASINGQSDYVKVLLSSDKTNYELCDKGGNNAIMLASRYGQVQVLRVVADHIICDDRINAKLIDLKNFDNKTALDLAYEANHYECVSVINTLKEALNNRRDIGSQVADNDIKMFNNVNKISDPFIPNTSRIAKQLSETESNALIKPQTKSHQNLGLSYNNYTINI